MLLSPSVAEGVRDGTVTQAYRRWRRSDVKVGAQFRTSAGVVRVDSVDVVEEKSITDKDAARAGHKDAKDLRKRLTPEPGYHCYRIGLSWAGEDSRIKLRNDAGLTDDDVAELDRRLDRLDDASGHGPWTVATLEIVGRRPQVRAPDLAQELGCESDVLKLDVRKLKNLGLTRSCEVGYEVSPRGVAYLARTRRGRLEPPPGPPAEAGKKKAKKLRLKLGKR